MKLRRTILAQRLRTMPMLTALVPFVAGMLLAARFELPVWFVVAAFLLCGAAALLLQQRSCLVGALVAAGYGATLLQPTRATVPPDLTLLVTLQVTEAGPRGTALIESWSDPATDRRFATQTAVQLRCDSTVQPEAGERIEALVRIRPIAGGSASYRRLMRSRGIAGTVRLTGTAIVGREAAARQTLHQRAVGRMNRLLQADAPTQDTLRRQAAAVVRAMTVGDRRSLPAPLRGAYARSGMAHLLAVSGLHTGIVFLLAHLLLGGLSLRYRGNLLRALLAIGAVWLYAAATGFPPATLRAALMCTLFQFAAFGTSVHQALNSWALTALLLLACRPAWLADISFQLSFVAVAAILAWGVPLANRCHTGRRYLDRPLQAVIIGLSASVATAPLVAHTFGILPLAGILLNPLVVLTGTLIVAGGLLLLLCPPLGGWLLPVTLQVAALQNRLAETVGSLHAAAVDTGLSATATALLYLLFALATVAAWAVEPRKTTRLPA